MPRALSDVSCVVTRNELHIIGGLDRHLTSVDTHYSIDLAALIPSQLVDRIRSVIFDLCRLSNLCCVAHWLTDHSLGAEQLQLIIDEWSVRLRIDIPFQLSKVICRFCGAIVFVS